MAILTIVNTATFAFEKLKNNCSIRSNPYYSSKAIKSIFSMLKNIPFLQDFDGNYRKFTFN